MIEIRIAETDEEIESCYDAMSELRPHVSREDFPPRVRRQMSASGFRLVYLADDGEVKAVAGARVDDWLARWHSLDLEDLVSTESHRSKGYGLAFARLDRRPRTLRRLQPGSTCFARHPLPRASVLSEKRDDHRRTLFLAAAQATRFC